MKEKDKNNLAAENEALKLEIAKLSKKLGDLEWASHKTNDGIKILYKELERTNQELKKLDQLKNDFVSTVSHELRTPLTTMRESVSLVLDGVLGEVKNEQKEVLSICLSDIDRLRRIIDNLLDISKIKCWGEIKPCRIKRTGIGTWLSNSIERGR